MSQESISRGEAIQLRVDVENLKLMHESTINAIKGTEEATKENTKLLSELIRKMDKHDIREQQRDDKIKTVENEMIKLNNLNESNKEVISRAKKSQARWDLFFNSMTSRAGVAVLFIISIGLSLAFGLDLSKLLK